MKVIIIGAGIGGLACAISCRREGLEVVVLEQAPALQPVGAGIQIPPNAARVLRKLGLLPQLIDKATLIDSIDYLRYKDGEVLYQIQGGEKFKQVYGDTWMVIARPDYHDVLWNAAKEAGVELRLGAEAAEIDFEVPSVHLATGEIVKGDVIVGADGLWSRSRDQILGRPSPPSETGDLAYRATLTLQQMKDLRDPQIDDLIKHKTVKCWMGPNKHCVLYPISGGQVFNLVIICPDDIPKRVRQAPGDVEEMRGLFLGWDGRLTKMLSSVTSVLKWKLCHHEELRSWRKGSIALLGDACHPTLPYQAQGAAMAVEDGAVLGILLGQLVTSGLYDKSKDSILDLLEIYENLRKSRTTINVQGARSNQQAYHLPDGPLQESRDAWLRSGPQDTSPDGFTFADTAYLRVILGFDALGESIDAFKKWEAGHAQVLPRHNL
ncbi:hypothetical protein BDP55DRAFT_584798 [Colletotrichum godetiae]|uniref:FAD-binding domain-containing protein n=1 Tax=Colletotrichum godetiae TaxID=1209918 RepID=A0AAJ0AHM2_9PEZI|nr:uncharacterized protein BDP55DRAFT_584798 [Colletotrichum godetiae]KAK1674055.1 hypothetical protein BDP55DRAFT_584798 [Colletotrichum godetiae]